MEVFHGWLQSMDSLQTLEVFTSMEVFKFTWVEVFWSSSFQKVCEDEGEKGVSVTGSLMAPSGKVIVFYREGNDWFCNAGLPSDITIAVDGANFHLHKFPLMSKCGKIAKIIEESQSAHEGTFTMTLEGFPGGPDTFLLAAKFCYGVRIEFTARNIIMVYCAADYLEMTDEYGEDNLHSRIPYCRTQHGGTCMENGAKIPANKEAKLPYCSSLFCASGIIDPSLPQFISIAAVSSFALGATLNTLVFPQLGRCDVFVYVSCAQTALLDSKEFLSPVSIPFEAMIAFSRGSQWTRAYVMEFHNLMTSFPMELRDQLKEARFSFLQGGYVEDFELEETSEENEDETLALVKAIETALQCSVEDLEAAAKLYISYWLELTTIPYGSLLDAAKMFWLVALVKVTLKQQLR
ncbi:hypothetical protein TEA_020201 [Camellia sinensis var. sinensis]|uniref:BTB domain-containing protein n=1 Tax=Camellia sinensis var. sinensis TaxID=542762 RepID=A0A4S4DMT5_CAMSN|nr:hypothetical protein TEA_020201 [Camellia sinensis var. sinensis]